MQISIAASFLRMPRNLVEDIEYLLHVKFRQISFRKRLKRRSWKSLSQFFFICFNLYIDLYETFSCVRRAKTLSYRGQHLCGRRRRRIRDVDKGGHLCFWIGPKNTNLLVEDIEHLLPVKFGQIPFWGKIEYISAILIQTERSSLFSDRL